MNLVITLLVSKSKQAYLVAAKPKVEQISENY